MNFGQWMQAHRRSLLFVIALLAIAGALTAFRLPISLFPNVAFPRAVVSLDAGDRPAEQMATLVTMPVEEALRRVPNVRDVESTTSRGAAEISINFDWGTDMAQATLQAQSAISEILATLPPGTSMQVRRMDPTVFPVLAYSLTSTQQSLSALRDLAQFQMRPLLSSVEGVARVDVTGGAQDEFEVAVDPARLAAYKLSLADVSKAIGAQQRADGHRPHRGSRQAVSGDRQHHHHAARRIAQCRGVRQRRDADPSGRCRDGRARASCRNGCASPPTARTRCCSTSTSSPARTASRSPRRSARGSPASQQQMPPGVHLSNWYDQSELVIASATSVRDAILIGVVLAALCCSCSCATGRSPRSPSRWCRPCWPRRSCCSTCSA